MRRLLIACDHAAFELKDALIQATQHEIEWTDLGTDGPDSVHYPDYAKDLCTKMLKERSKEELLEPCGVLICGSGVGMSIAANRHRKIRAVLALRPDVARLSRQHNASNVLCMGARLIDSQEALTILRAWLEAAFEGGRHEHRVRMMDE